jgi:hypothetical protein
MRARFIAPLQGASFVLVVRGRRAWRLPPAVYELSLLRGEARRPADAFQDQAYRRDARHFSGGTVAHAHASSALDVKKLSLNSLVRQLDEIESKERRI